MNNHRDYFDTSSNYSKSEKEYPGDQESYNNINSKRGKMLSAFNLTKNVYLPTVSSSLRQLTNEASTSFKRYYNNNGSSSSNGSNPDLDYQTIGNGVNANQLLLNNGNNNNGNDLDDLDITVYDVYTHFNPLNKKYITEIKGNVCLYNNISRKNKWVYMGLKKLIIGSNKEEMLVDQDLEMLNNVDTESQYELLEKTMDMQSNASYSSSNKKNSTIFDSRIYPFLNKGVSCFPLVLKLNDIGLEHCLTKGNGDFEISLQTDIDVSLDEEANKLSLMTNLRPQSVIVQRQMDNNGFDSSYNDVDFKDFSIDIKPIHYSEKNKFGIISDIDDTIKFTGVVESKKIILDNTFNKPIESWLLPSMANWYKFLKYKYNVDFFYVSNSPQQLYTTLKTYIDKYFPSGAIILKEYLQSNIFSNFLGSSATKKLERILRVVDQYSYKKFILIGDSGESDLEAYIQVCKLRPNNIVGVYIRAVKGSMSDHIAKEEKIVVEFNKLIDEKYYNAKNNQETITTGAVPPTLPPRTVPKFEIDSNVSYSSEDSASTISNTSTSKSAGVAPPPPPPPRNSSSRASIITPERVSNINPYNYQLSNSLEDIIDIDKKKENWRYRISTCMMDLRSIYRNTDNKIQVKFFQDELIEESCELIKKVKDKSENGNLL